MGRPGRVRFGAAGRGGQDRTARTICTSFPKSLRSPPAVGWRNGRADPACPPSLARPIHPHLHATPHTPSPQQGLAAQKLHQIAMHLPQSIYKKTTYNAATYCTLRSSRHMSSYGSIDTSIHPPSATSLCSLTATLTGTARTPTIERNPAVGALVQAFGPDLRGCLAQHVSGRESVCRTAAVQHVSFPRRDDDEAGLILPCDRLSMKHCSRF